MTKSNLVTAGILLRISIELTKTLLRNDHWGFGYLHILSSLLHMWLHYCVNIYLWLRLYWEEFICGHFSLYKTAIHN